MSESATVAGMVRRECANWRPDGTCLLIERRTERGRAVGVKCPAAVGGLCGIRGGTEAAPELSGRDWLASCVVPLGKARPEYASAASEYMHRCGVVHVIRVRTCECGVALGSRTRYCGACKKKREREAKAKWWANRASGEKAQTR